MDEQKNKIAHLSFIEDNISKMTQYCVNLKGWLVAILVGLFALTINSTIDRWILFGVAAFIVVVFCALDAFYLHQERKFRFLYDDVRKKKEEEIDFSMAISGQDYINKVKAKGDKTYERRSLCYWHAFLSKSVWPFYGAMLVLSVGLFLLKMWIGG